MALVPKQPNPQPDSPKTANAKTKRGCLWIIIGIVAIIIALIVPACMKDAENNKKNTSSTGLSSANAIVACGDYAEKYLQPNTPSLEVKAHTVADSEATLDSSKTEWSVRVGIDVGYVSHNAYCTVSGTSDSPRISEFRAA